MGTFDGSFLVPIEEADITGRNTWRQNKSPDACTSLTVLSRAFQADITAAIGRHMYGGGEMTLMQTPASNGLCIVTTGTTPTLQGFITYVQM